jgi:hypothetical protein
MSDNKLVSRTAFTLFALAVVLLILTVFTPLLEWLNINSAEPALWVIGFLSLLSTVLGFSSFKTPQGKIAAIGGAILLLVILVFTPTNVAYSS